jgi:uncharacterized protein YuzE
MNITYDAVADAVYLKMSAGKVAKTLKMQDRLIVDVDKKNNVIGIEILEASAQKGLIKNLEKGVLDGIPVAMTLSTPQLA